ncbi:putative DNA repair protein Rad4 [Aspergillus candidus]|uniref:Rad4-domain-containing protein n=1 Tax=Aspergillus candidus TaxID=41067 RepID=A0A2I2FM61_ASPCN|nr:Rad4-domain-containing protein [Aspergillus candidus]PLB41700.1 Rad4-domain-containing protein [Aspergillus candidus]
MRQTTATSSGKQRDDNDIPAVYQEMLAEAEARDPHAFDSTRQIKRRRVQTSDSPSRTPGSTKNDTSDARGKDVSQAVQTVYDSPSSDESDMEWEEVDLEQKSPQAGVVPGLSPAAGQDEDSIQITLDAPAAQRQKTVSRKPISNAERKLRLDLHKVHLLCLLRHVQIRNLWCNDDVLQGFLKQMLPRRIISLLNPPEDKPQHVRSTTFVDGLNQASEAFLRRFRITSPGIQRPHWADNLEAVTHKAESIMADTEVFLSKDDFLAQARNLQGSRDFGAQLFCALLRSAAVEARLVCSLQPLPFSGAVTDRTPAKKSHSQSIATSSDDREISTDKRSPSDTAPSRTRRLARPHLAPSRPRKVATTRPARRESSYPVFWVEAFNESVQKWIPVDPLVTKSLAKAFKFEPPSSDPYNCMSYVVAFEEDASARDVTRRYTKAFNAKTRKLRVETSKNGEQWWLRALRFYEKPFLEDRDEAEISELTAKSAAEPMPRNIQDFKDHPFYALERHLRRNEVILPRRVIGQVSLGKSGSKHEKLEPVYRRSDVHIVRSADKWYRLGRDVKLGEQPLKRVPASGQRGFNDEGTAVETAMYALSQTEVYTPPPIVNGKVPRNGYGNLDIYVPSMIPAGGVHITHPNAAQAARILGIDYADAVVGFNFKGRHGTAVFEGVVVAEECHDAMRAVLAGLDDQQEQAASDAKSMEMLRLWKTFLLKLRIAERVKAYAMEEDSGGEMTDDEMAEMGGGFLPESDPDEGGGFLSELSHEVDCTDDVGPGKT